MRPFKLSSVVLDAEDFLADDAELLYRVETGSSCAYDAAAGELVVRGLVDFTTYLNACSVAKWRKYAAIDNVKLRVEAAGDAFTLAVLALREDAAGGFSAEVVDACDIDAASAFEAHEIAMPLDCAVAGFAILSRGATRIRSACYHTEIDAGRIRPVRLALCTTTFRKEGYILDNVKRIREGVLGCGEAIAEAFHLFVVDNGRTLDAEGLSGDGVTVIPNPNVGGAGGFARGMMAAQDDERGFTHVILMDDDVRMLPESFKRLFALLSIARPEYAGACVNGAMLQLEHPSVQFEDVSYMRRIGGYQAVKPRLDMGEQASIVRNELIDVEVDNAYGAWWFSCIPMPLVEKAGLPLPFFIRCDDVEYGLRCQAKYMTMNGICVWHAQFAGRFNAAIVCYQYARNLHATVALHGCYDERVFMVQFWRTLSIYLRTMDYAAAGLWLDGFEDYLKGPGYLMGLDGAALVRANSAKAEKFAPVEELDPDVMGRLDVNLDWLDGDPAARSRAYKAAATLPHDRHWFPGFMLSDKPGMLAPGAGDDFTPWRKTAMRKILVAMALDGKSGAVRTIDRKRHHALVKRYHALMADWRERGKEVARQWQDALPEMSSRAFWEKYLAERFSAD